MRHRNFFHLILQQKGVESVNKAKSQEKSSIDI